MALRVTFPENEDVFAFERKNEVQVLLVGILGTYKKELGNYAGYWLRKCTERIYTVEACRFHEMQTHVAPRRTE